MDKAFLEIRKKGLEETFFAKENEKLLKKLKEKAAAEEQKKALAEVTGISDDAVLDKIVEQGLCCETAVALFLVPLVEVAWADGEIQAKEREAILKAAEAQGTEPDSIAHEILENWLHRKPEAKLLETWKSYVAALIEELPEDAVAQIKDGVISGARGVAEAAGGFLGLTSKVSAEEKAMLEELEAAF